MIARCGRSSISKADPKLDDSLTLEPSPDDYIGAYAAYKFDRGHMAPLGSFDGYERWHEVNYYSNIVPQKASLNRGAWKKLESVERELVEDCLNLYVMCGTIYEDSMPSLPT